MKIITTMIAFACIAAQASAQTTTNKIDSILLLDAKAAIAKGNAQWAEGWRRGDAAMVSAIFEDDGVQLSLSGRVIRGRQQIQEVQKKGMQSVDTGVIVTINTLNVWIVGQTAYETGTYKYEYKENGKPSLDTGRYVTQWRKQKDGAWKLYLDMALSKD